MIRIKISEILCWALIYTVLWIVLFGLFGVVTDVILFNRSALIGWVVGMAIMIILMKNKNLRG